MSEKRAPYNAGEARELEESIIQVITFNDGSRLRIFVDATTRESGLSLAHLGYYRRLFKPLEELQQESRPRGES